MTIRILMIIGIVHAFYAQDFNSNPRQQDHSGGLNLQIDTSSTGTQYIGSTPSRSDAVVPLSYNPYDSPRRSGFNSNPRQQDHSGRHNSQIDTSSTSTQYIGPKPSGIDTVVPLSYNPYGSSRRAGFNSNPRQQDLSGSSSNIQIDTSSTSRQYIGPSRDNQYPMPSSVGRPQIGNGFNSNPKQQDLSGGRNLQIDTSENSKQYIEPGVMRPGFDGFGDSDSEEGVEYQNYGKGPSVRLNGRDYTGRNVQQPGLHINQNPY